MRFVVLSALLITLVAPADAFARSGLQFVGESSAPARSDDGRSAVLLPAPGGFVTTVNASGRIDTRAIPSECPPRRLRYPRLLLACSIDGMERPSVLNVATGKLQTTAAADAAATASATFHTASTTFHTAGRYWLAGFAPDAYFGYLTAVVRQRYTGEQYRVWTGTPILDSPTYAVTPAKGESAPCGAGLITTRNRLFAMVCGKRSLVKRCPRGCYAVASNHTSGAYVEHGRLNQVTLRDARALRSWRLPAGRRDRIKLLVTGNALFASVLRGATWHVFRDELAPVER